MSEETAPPPQKRASWLQRYAWSIAALLLAALVFSNLFAGPRLEGKPAPALSAMLLDGSVVDLAQHRDAEVVVLNFWASWCPPCVQEMPALDILARNLLDKPVKFYACNVGEAPAVVQAFLERTQVTLPIILDESGDIAQRFRVNSLPVTFIIGRDGIVQHEYSGYVPGLEHEMREHILALL